MGSDLSGKVAIVTGASRGIGLAIATTMAEHGANVVITSRKNEAAEAAAQSVGPQAVGYQAHATDESAAASCVGFTLERFGRLDVLVNNAGTNPAFGRLVDVDYARFAKTMDVNAWAPVLWTAVAWRGCMEEHGGVVVNTASLGGLVVAPELGAYHASKAALIHLTRHLAVELGPRVRVNGIAPGVVRTRLAEALWRDGETRIAEAAPLKRIGEPADVAGAVAFLASDASSWITGETLVIDGGYSIGSSTVTGDS
jgi:NAD(P)-dependent dehydrogenase (short-subunit alcohol dehydrogenase family)